MQVTTGSLQVDAIPVLVPGQKRSLKGERTSAGREPSNDGVAEGRGHNGGGGDPSLYQVGPSERLFMGVADHAHIKLERKGCPSPRTGFIRPAVPGCGS